MQFVRSLIVLTLCGPAVGRFTRLVVNDKWPFERFRDWLDERSVLSVFWMRLEEMFTCPWCLSGWASLVASAVVWRLYGLPVPPMAWMALWWLSCACYWATEALAKAGVPDEGPPEHLDLDPDGFR